MKESQQSLYEKAYGLEEGGMFEHALAVRTGVERINIVDHQSYNLLHELLLRNPTELTDKWARWEARQGNK